MKNIIKLITIFICLISMISCSNNKQDIDNDINIFENATVSYLGPEGTYTQEASEYFFSNAKQMIAEETVDKAIESLLNDKSDFAVIPQENSIGGSVTNYVDALIRNENIYVVGEIIIPISQTLMAIEGSKIEDIQIVYSHEQGLLQSEKWRKENMPNVKTEKMSSTAAAVSYVAEQNDKTIAAIGAPIAAKIYGLNILAENVQITNTNKTRFYVLAKSPLTSKHTNATLIVKCNSNYIDDIIVRLHNANLELVSIHDRPQGDELGNYNYVIEVTNLDGINESQIKLINSIKEIRFLGCFKVIEK